MRKASGNAKPDIGTQVLGLMIKAGAYSPGFRELDGTTYRVLDFEDGNVEVPKHLRDKFVGAIAEWANDKSKCTGVVLYQDRETFGSDFARIDICAKQI